MTRHARICGCGAAVPRGIVCACSRRRQTERPSAAQRGYGADWSALRATIPHTPCTACARPWKAGMHLDHRVARKAGGTDDASNLHWLCWPCHSRKTAKHNGGFGHAKTPPPIRQLSP
ncbi:HNH endonuclease [Tardiphaga sp. vice352]|uniref:HNH endonuclease n=1 Tax=Tardiphaga sp. vice352 TaxID=2592816 RepID=UPI0034A0ACFA